MDLKKMDMFLRNKTEEAVVHSRLKWRERSGRVQKPTTNSLIFLGTGGNPEANIGQHPRTAGFIVNLGDLFLWVDPGPGAFHSVHEHNIDLGSLDAVYISHGHVDHYAAAEILVEGMCWAMSARRGILLGPESIFTSERQISEYHQGESNKSGYFGGPEVKYLKNGNQIKLKDVVLTPTPAYHGSENFGFVLEHNGFRLGYTSDTNYIRSYRNGEGIQEVKRIANIQDFVEVEEFREDVKAAYAGVDVLIANVTTHNYWAHRHITTLGLPHLLADSGIKACYITHFNYSCVEPTDLRELMATYVSEKSGIKVMPAFDNLKVDLSVYLTK